MLCDGVLFEEDILRLNYEQNKQEFNRKVFYKTQTENTYMETFRNDVVLYGGIDPWDTITDNKFEFFLGFSPITGYLWSYCLLLVTAFL